MSFYSFKTYIFFCNSSLELILKNNERKWKIEETKEEKNDIIITGSHSMAITQLINDLHSSFALKDLG
jgi:hypothetical protein